MKHSNSKYRSIVILTGAGVSAESGIKTFRDHNGLWENHSIEEVASLAGFQRNPEVVQRFYNQRRAQLLDPSVQPNLAHQALVKLEKAWKGDFLLVTQNVDDLHDRAGSRMLLHMHGELQKVRCLKTRRVSKWTGPIEAASLCPCCNQTGTLRPHIVWFGEMPLEMDSIDAALATCDLFASIGTSGHVYPAAGFVGQARRARKIEINLEASVVSKRFDEHRIGAASECVPRLVDELLDL
ncbi:Sir2 family NAD+-dependent deacetylase [Bdellovibrionota bacterium FG-1]